MMTAPHLADALGITVQSVGQHRAAGMPARKATRTDADALGVKLNVWLYDVDSCRAWRDETVAQGIGTRGGKLPGGGRPRRRKARAAPPTSELLNARGELACPDDVDDATLRLWRLREQVSFMRAKRLALEAELVSVPEARDSLTEVVDLVCATGAEIPDRVVRALRGVLPEADRGVVFEIAREHVERLAAELGAKLDTNMSELEASAKRKHTRGRGRAR